MADRSNLVPTQVTDKNGVTTTRWKRPVASSPALSKLPAPQMPPSVDDPQGELDASLRENGFVMQTIILDVVKMGSKIYDRSWRDEFKNRIRPETLTALDDAYSTDYGEIIPFVKACLDRHSSADMNNAALFIDVKEYAPDNDSYLDCIAGLQWLHGTEHRDYSTLNTKEQEGGRALVRAALKMGNPFATRYVNGSATMKYIPSRNLAGLISRRPDDVDKIVEILRERRFDVFSDDGIRSIEALLEGSTTGSLGSGVL